MGLPLKGVKILDFSTLLPGPYATQLLADMGAEVLRIEAPNRPDLLKLMPPMAGKVSAAHASINRNKKSLALDLKHPDAKGIILSLLKDYDVVVEQFRPGVMQRLGLDYASLSEVQPGLIYCSITGYGQTGELKDRAGHDINYLALSGLASYSGRADTGPVLSATQIADIAGGSHHAVMAIQAALFQRLQNGEGQFLDISMADAALSLNTMFGAGALVSGRDPELGGEMLNGGLFYDYYETADGRYFSVGSLEPNFAVALLAALNLNEYASKFGDQRKETQQEIREAIKQRFKAHEFAYWTECFAKLDACVEPVLTVNEAVKHPHFQQRGMVVKATDAEGNEFSQLKSALPFESAEPIRAGAPLGKHTDEVLEELGLSGEEIMRLKSEGAVKS